MHYYLRKSINVLITLCMIGAAGTSSISAKMRKFRENKLWRDKGPACQEARGSIIHLKSLTDEEYEAALRNKLIEEALEVKGAKTEEELIRELADMYEVIDTLIAFHGLQKETVLSVQESKRDRRGGLVERKFVTIAEHPEGSYNEKYCLSDPEKHPEVID